MGGRRRSGGPDLRAQETDSHIRVTINRTTASAVMSVEL